MKKIKILVAMSGGVDSSAAAALLLGQGYDVTGAFMVNYQASSTGLRLTSSDDEFTGRSEAEPCWRGDYQDAVRVAAKLGIKLLRLDFTKEYKKLVLDYMFREYRAGRTPNPDVMCNKFIKFGVWLKKAKELGFDKLATGHYARLRSATPGQASIILLQAKDDNKDQTYFLHQLTQKQLQHVLFPLGDYTKPEVRKLAKKFALPTADKEESMGICFIGEVDMKKFLQTKIKSKPGDIVFDGTIIGKHDGLAFYTIGQRCHPERSEGSLSAKGGPASGGKQPYPRDSSTSLRSARNDNTKPLFVLDKNIKKNQLIIGYEDDPLLYKKEIIVKNVNWISGHPPKMPLKCLARLRHRQPLQVCHCEPAGRSNLIVKFAKPQRAVTPGQFAVFYLADECLGGGIIK